MIRLFHLIYIIQTLLAIWHEASYKLCCGVLWYFHAFDYAKTLYAAILKAATLEMDKSVAESNFQFALLSSTFEQTFGLALSV